MITHPFPALFDENSQILILGSFPSVKSREQNFYYGHPQNRFWRVMSIILQEPLPETIVAKKEILHRHHIALFDVIRSCDIEGSSDSTIRNVVVNDLSEILGNSKIGEHIYVNGNKARDLYMKYTYPQTGIACTTLPSTSPANAACSQEKLVSIWSEKLQIS